MTVTEQSFLADVKTHQMSILRDDGVYRHVRFAKPGSADMYFDLITWPGSLCYTGDMGTFVFARDEDMFRFFGDWKQPGNGLTLYINPRYWAEKVQGAERNEGIMEFNEALFDRAVVGDLVRWIRSHADVTTKEERRELWDAVMNDVIGADGDTGGLRKQIAAHDFYHAVNAKAGSFSFEDFGEHRVEDYTRRFMWCCYALAWGVKQYDVFKAKTPAAA